MRPHEIAECLGFREVRPGQWEGRCPAHDDRTASAGIAAGENGGTVVRCLAGCEFAEIVRASGLSFRDFAPPLAEGTEGKSKRRGKTVARYDYRDEDGGLLYQVLRLEPKSFRQRRPDGAGGWEWSTKGIEKTLYRLPEIADSGDETIVYVVEGEKDADRLAALGLVATCNTGGAGAGKWPESGRAWLENRHVVLLPDNDREGLKHAQRIASALEGAAASIRIVTLPGLPEKGDVSDWLSAGGDRSALEELVAGADRVGHDRDQFTVTSSPTSEKGGFDHPNAPGADAEIQPPPIGEPERARRIEVRVTAPSAAPMRLAELWLALEASDDDDTPLVRHWRGDWYRWSPERGHYVELEGGEMRARLRVWLDTVDVPAQGKDDEWTTRPLKVNRALVSEVADALQVPGLRVHTGEAPRWLDDTAGKPSPDELLVAPNGLYHLPTGELLPATPKLFAVAGIGAEVHADAGEPLEWLKFLRALWPNDSDSILCLQEWIGYLLTGDTRHHKILLLVGPPRGGKGTIARVIRALLGAHACAGPTLGSLTERFGLESLLGRLVAIVSDARLSGRADQAQIVERLLSVSGEDPVDVDRKNKRALNTQLSARFMLMSNELPRLADSSGAMSSRFVVLTLSQSWLDREDTDLLERLQGDMPGILAWAIEGWRRLRARGRFLQPSSAAAEIEELSRIGSPVSAFLADATDVGGEALADDKRYWTSTDDFYAAWRRWCDGEGRAHPGTKAVFARDLRSAAPEIKKVFRTDELGRRRPGYSPVRLLRQDEIRDDDFGDGQSDLPF